jgi:hypothetical protein
MEKSQLKAVFISSSAFFRASYGSLIVAMYIPFIK